MGEGAVGVLTGASLGGIVTRPPLIESGILLASLCAVLLNMFFNGTQGDTTAAVQAAKQAQAH